MSHALLHPSPCGHLVKRVGLSHLSQTDLTDAHSQGHGSLYLYPVSPSKSRERITTETPQRSPRLSIRQSSQLSPLLPISAHMTCLSPSHLLVTQKTQKDAKPGDGEAGPSHYTHMTEHLFATCELENTYARCQCKTGLKNQGASLMDG